jgi:beta-lactamase regulating signal transducer with metallopeptidase domain
MQRRAAADVALSQRASAKAADQARLAEIVTGILVILLAVFVATMLVVIRRLLSRIRATAEVLGVSVVELRSSSRDSAAAASEPVVGGGGDVGDDRGVGGDGAVDC